MDTKHLEAFVAQRGEQFIQTDPARNLAFSVASHGVFVYRRTEDDGWQHVAYLTEMDISDLRFGMAEERLKGWCGRSATA